MTYGPILVACIIGACLVWLMAGKIRHGSSCCGEHEGPDKRIRSGDRNPKHYPHHYLLQIEGMVCGNCVRNVENAFHSVGGVLAKADLGTRTAKVYTKQPINEEDAARILSGTSYVLVGFQNKEAIDEIK